MINFARIQVIPESGNVSFTKAPRQQYRQGCNKTSKHSIARADKSAGVKPESARDPRGTFHHSRTKKEEKKRAAKSLAVTGVGVSTRAGISAPPLGRLAFSAGVSMAVLALGNGTRGVGRNAIAL